MQMKLIFEYILVQYFGWKGTTEKRRNGRKAMTLIIPIACLSTVAVIQKAKRYVSRSGCSISKSMKPDHVLRLLKFDVLNSQFRALFHSNPAMCHSKCAVCYRWCDVAVCCCRHRLCRHSWKFHLILDVFIILQSDKLLFRRQFFFLFFLLIFYCCWCSLHHWFNVSPLIVSLTAVPDSRLKYIFTSYQKLHCIKQISQQ